MSLIISLDRLSDFLTNLKGLFVTKTDANSTYATKAELNTSETTANDTYLSKLDAKATYATKAETDTLLRGKSDISHNHNSVYLGISAKAESAKSADSVAWANVSGRPTKVSQFTNDSGYITSSGSCNYANSAGSAPANGGTSTASAYLNSYETLQYGVNRLQYFNIATPTTSGAGNIANPTNDWYYHIIQSHGNPYGYYFDIASHFNSNSVYYRRIAGGSESGWIKFIDSDNIGSQSVNYANSAGSAGSATNATYANWLRTSSHSDHLFHTEWDGAYFWTYVTAGDGGYRAVRVARSDSAATAEACTGNAATATTATYASRSANNGGFYISGYLVTIG